MFRKGRMLMVALSLVCASTAFADDGLNTGSAVGSTVAPAAGPQVFSEATRGVVFSTAAINSDGSVASCFGCDSVTTERIAVGTYQVNFSENVQARNGWSRWVQPDTLTIGFVNAYCTTADRAGLPTAIFVRCQAPGGPGSQGRSIPVDTSFFLFVAR